MHSFVISIGNSSIRSGLFSGNRLIHRARIATADLQLAAPRRRLLAAAKAHPATRALLGSVVPRLTAEVRELVRNELGIRPVVLRPNPRHGLRLAYRRPGELGSDRFAAALGARARFPNRNLIVVDCGTATTLTVVDRGGTLRGGAILPGVGLWPALLAAHTAQLPRIPLTRPRKAVGTSPAAAIRSGIFHGHAGAIRELLARLQAEAFGRQQVTVIATGGHARLFKSEKLFTVTEPDLILYGLHTVLLRLQDHA